MKRIKMTDNRTTLYIDDVTLKLWHELSEYYGLSRAAIVRMLITKEYNIVSKNDEFSKSVDADKT